MPETIELNSQQQAAVEFGKQDHTGNFNSTPLLIIAGAGTGKTNTLAHRVAYLINNNVDSEKILLMTFSRRAAKELVERSKRILRSQLKFQKTASLQLPWTGTFHSVANRLLRYYAKSIGMDSGFTVIDRNDAEDLIDILRHELNLTTTSKRFPKKSTCLNIYSRCINSQDELATVLKKDFPWCEHWQAQLKQLFALYTERKIQQLSLDYDDLLLYWYHLVADPKMAAFIAAKFDHVLIDEYQDTNLLQAGILTRLFPNGKGLTVVGDDAQSIYSFRSAEVDNILNFPRLFKPAAKVIALSRNYRSIQPILDLSNRLLSDSKVGYKKNLVSDKCGSHKPELISVEDDSQQALYIVRQLLKEREAGTALRDQAILFRSSHHSDRLEIELMRHDIPFVKYGGLKFLEAAHVKDFIAIARWAENPKHRISGFRILKLIPGIGPATAMKALDYLELNNFQFSSLETFSAPPAAENFWSALITLLVDTQNQAVQWPAQMDRIKNVYLPLLDENYESDLARSGDIEQLVNLSQQYASCEQFTSELTLEPPISSSDLASSPHKDDDFVILSTIHSAKGQEWKNVFILNVADGNFPNEYAAGDNKAIEEERRLLNVAITRAKQNLHLIQPLKYWVPEQAKNGSRHVYGAKSRFLTKGVCSTLKLTHWSDGNYKVTEPQLPYPALNNIQDAIRNRW